MRLYYLYSVRLKGYIYSKIELLFFSVRNIPQLKQILSFEKKIVAGTFRLGKEIFLN